ncbi:hypothetical protein O181_073577 [Austropuccinia psidii MF-1]|uniref:CCHC-type domain-containing protein n=1 Tax=Austropuccinia psidii MF-1 TaxID=1389203 RepID=A0A9Q3IB64_9BASI|nr:hypothetical protein [Austropuccinia psidii MF-1]
MPDIHINTKMVIICLSLRWKPQNSFQRPQAGPNSLEQENMIIWSSFIILMDSSLIYQAYQTTGLLLDSIKHSKDMLVFWYTEMKEIHGRRNWPWWKSQIIQKYSNDDIANTLQDVRKQTNIGKYSPYKSNGFKEKQPFRVEFKEKPSERVAEVAKKKISCHNCGSKDHYSKNCPKGKKKVYAIEKFPAEKSPTKDSESDSMGDSIREQYDDEQDSREERLLEYEEETPLEIQDIQLEAGRPQDTGSKNLCKHTQDAQTFLVTPTKGMAYKHGTATRMTVCIENA